MKNCDRINWSALITDLLEVLVITKIRLALKCDVTEASISNWTTGTRTPNDFARYILVELSKDNGLDLNYYKIKRKAKKPVTDACRAEVSLPKDILEFACRLSALSRSTQKKIIEMAEYMIISTNKTS